LRWRWRCTNAAPSPGPNGRRALTAAIRRAQAAGDPDPATPTTGTGWTRWKALVITKGLADADRLHALEHAWEAAAARTPHGQPIELNEAERALAD
jgi:hypothetical protein